MLQPDVFINQMCLWFYSTLQFPFNEESKPAPTAGTRPVCTSWWPAAQVHAPGLL